MTLLVLMGVVGACVGAWLKPRLAAVPGMLALVAAVRALIGVLAPMAVGQTAAPYLAQVAFQFVQDPADDYVPLLGVAGGSALIAMLFALAADRRARGAMTLEEATRARRRIRQGRFVRATGMLDPRKGESEAAERLRSILGP